MSKTVSLACVFGMLFCLFASSICWGQVQKPETAKSEKQLQDSLPGIKEKVSQMKKSSQELPLLLELQADQMDITKIKEQQILVNKIQSLIKHKDKEIASLQSLLNKYQQYQQKYQSIKI